MTILNIKTNYDDVSIVIDENDHVVELDESGRLIVLRTKVEVPDGTDFDGAVTAVFNNGQWNYFYLESENE